jgi:hypothetical protein
MLYRGDSYVPLNGPIVVYNSGIMTDPRCRPMDWEYDSCIVLCSRMRMVRTILVMMIVSDLGILGSWPLDGSGLMIIGRHVLNDHRVSEGEKTNCREWSDQRCTY